MKQRKTGAALHKQTKLRVGENNFLHSDDFSALILAIRVRQPEHAVQPEVFGHKRKAPHV